MSDKFQNKYRIPSTRLQSWNYGWPGAYFITLCTYNREHFFGEIENGILQLSELGKTVETEWVKTPDIRPDMNLQLDAFAVMPNHFHAIIIIGENEFNTKQNNIKQNNTKQNNTKQNNTIRGDAKHQLFRDAKHRVSTNKFSPQSKNLASIVRGFKSSINTYARKNDIPFQWQARFYDHIISNGESYHRIKNYIAANPQNWENDELK